MHTRKAKAASPDDSETEGLRQEVANLRRALAREQQRCADLDASVAEKDETIAARDAKIAEWKQTYLSAMKKNQQHVEQLSSSEVVMGKAAAFVAAELDTSKVKLHPPESMLAQMSSSSQDQQTVLSCLAEYKTSSPCLAFFIKSVSEDPGPPERGHNVDRAEKRNQLRQLLAITNIIAAYFPKWRDPWMFQVTCALRCNRHVAGLMTAANPFLPGSMSTRQQDRIISSQATRSILDFQLPEFGDDDVVICCYDNVNDKNLKCSRNSVANKKAKQIKVTTARMILVTTHPSAKKIMNDPANHPLTMAQNYPHHSRVHDALIISGDADADNHDDMSDLDYYRAILRAQMKKCVRRVMEQDRWSSETRGEDLLVEQLATANALKMGKECLFSDGGCGQMNANSFGYCRGCGQPLLTLEAIAAVRQRTKGPVNIIDLLLPQGDKESRKFKGRQQPASMATATPIQERQDAEKKRDVTRIILPMLDISPASHEAQEIIHADFARLLEYPEKMKMVIFCTDVGALNLAKVLSDRYEFETIIAGMGHVEMCATRLVLGLGAAVAGPKFAQVHGFTTKNSMEYLYAGSNNHFSFDFIMIQADAFACEFVKQYLLETATATPLPPDFDCRNESHLEKLTDSVLTWMDNNEEDCAFASYATFVDVTWTGNLLLRKGLHSNDGKGNPFAIEAAIRKLIPYWYSEHFTKYGPYMAHYLVKVLERCTPDMRELFRSLYARSKEGLEFQIEQLIQANKRKASAKGSAARRMAMAKMMTEEACVKAFRDDVGLDTRNTKPDKLPIDQEEDLEAMCVLLREQNLFQKREGRRIVLSADGTQRFRPGQDLVSRVKRGHDSMIADCKSGFQIGMPSAVAMLEQGALDLEALRDDIAFGAGNVIGDDANYFADGSGSEDDDDEEEEYVYEDDYDDDAEEEEVEEGKMQEA